MFRFILSILYIAYGDMCNEACDVIKILADDCPEMCTDSDKIMKCISRCDTLNMACYINCAKEIQPEPESTLAINQDTHNTDLVTCPNV